MNACLHTAHVCLYAHEYIYYDKIVCVHVSQSEHDMQ